MKWVVLLLFLLIPGSVGIGVDESVSIGGAGVSIQDQELSTPMDGSVRVCAVVTCLGRGMDDEAARAEAERQAQMDAKGSSVARAIGTLEDAPPWAFAVPAAGLFALAARLYWLGPGRIAAILMGPGRLFGLGLMARFAWPVDLENETRQSMKMFIETHPGTSIQDARHHAGVAWGTAVYHLQRMEKDGDVVSIRAGNHHRYWIAGTAAAGVRHAWAILEQPTTAMIAGAVHGNPGIHQSGLCDQLKLKTPTASKHLKRLVASGLVMTKRCSRFIMYAPTERLDEVMRLRVAH